MQIVVINICLHIKAGLDIVYIHISTYIFLGKAGILVLVNLKTGMYLLSSIKVLVWI